MTQKDFIQECAKRGYCAKKQAMAYCLKHTKDEYTEDDLLDAYRYVQRMMDKDYSNLCDTVSLGRTGSFRYKRKKPYYE